MRGECKKVHVIPTKCRNYGVYIQKYDMETIPNEGKIAKYL